jgi:hypothetical protein
VSIVDALAEVLIGGIVRESLKLLLYGRRKSRVLDNGILRVLVSEVRVEISHVEYGFLKVQFAWYNEEEHDRGYSQHLA